jgi:hypothetical protein
MLQAGQPRSTRWSFYLYGWMSSRNIMLHSKLDIPTPPFPPVGGHDQRVSRSSCDTEFAMFAHHRRSTSSSSDRARSARLGPTFRNRPYCIVEEKLDTACNTAMTKDEGDDEAHSDDRGPLPPAGADSTRASMLAITPEYASLSDLSTCHMIRHCA